MVTHDAESQGIVIHQIQGSGITSGDIHYTRQNLLQQPVDIPFGGQQHADLQQLFHLILSHKRISILSVAKHTAGSFAAASRSCSRRKSSLYSQL